MVASQQKRTTKKATSGANTSNNAHGLGKDIHKNNTENTTTTRGNFDWEDGH